MALYIIHLTDIHLTGNTDCILRKKEQLISACCNYIHSPADILICVTGDLSYSGTTDQLSVFKSYITDIANKISDCVKPDSLTIHTVPGNHDCDFSKHNGVRDVLLGAINSRSTDGFISDCVSQISRSVQDEYLSFSADNDWGLTPDNYLCCVTDLALQSGTIRMVHYNTAWMSTIHEQAGNLCMPINLLQEVSCENADLVISMMHHPLGWIHPDNRLAFESRLRSSSDLLLCGHEHIADLINQSGRDWNYRILEGKELQASASTDNSSFAIYSFDNLFSTITCRTFIWNNGTYCSDDPEETPFSRNLANQSRSVFPNQETIDDLHDVGAILHHPFVDTLSLDDIFIWPDLEQLPEENSKTTIFIHSDNVYSHLIDSKFCLIHGDESQGKTSLVKALYLRALSEGKCCIRSTGKSFNARRKEGILREINDLFCEQYSKLQLTNFHNLDYEKKVLIIDDFEQIAYNTEKTDYFLDVLQENFSSIILLTSTDMSISVLLTRNESVNATYYRIKHLGPRKKDELIEKWYSLGRIRSGYTDAELDTVIDNSTRIIDGFLGGFSILMPATPLYILSILQTIDSTGSTVLKGHSYAYERIAKYSLDLLSSGSAISENVYVSILSHTAYNMLLTKKMSISSTELVDQINHYAKTALIDMNVISLITKLVESKILINTTGDRYRFRYPYLYYYFCGYYISKNIANEDVQKQLEYMSSMLHVIEYGNIMIFVAHFINSDTVLQNIMLNAMCSFDGVKPFDFVTDSALLDEALSDLDNDIKNVSIGKESDVSERRHKDQKLKDEHIDLSHDALETADSIDESAYDSIEIGNIISAMRIIEVLGQILKNYPGDITGEIKIETIDEIKSLSMRIVGALYDSLGSVKTLLISDLVKEAKKSQPDIPDTVLEETTRRLFHRVVFSVAYSMLTKASHAIASPLLIPALQVMVERNPDDVAIALIKCNTGLISKASPDYEYVIELNKKLKRQNRTYAQETLRMLVANHLRRRHCGERMRDRLCTEFELKKEYVLPPRARPRIAAK